jgi:hypothetical protein
VTVVPTSIDRGGPDVDGSDIRVADVEPGGDGGAMEESLEQPPSTAAATIAPVITTRLDQPESENRTAAAFVLRAQPTSRVRNEDKHKRTNARHGAPETEAQIAKVKASRRTTGDKFAQ